MKSSVESDGGSLLYNTLSVSLFVYVTDCLSVCQTVYPFVSLLVWRFVCVSVCPWICLPVSSTVCMSLC